MAMTADGPGPASSPRSALRRQLLSRRDAFAASDAFAAAEEALAGHLRRVLRDLEPTCLGAYWAVRGEFNVTRILAADAGLQVSQVPLALPASRRAPREMQFRLWDGRSPAARDDWGIPTADGPPVVPDVVLVPCVGHTPSALRVGYGGGYFDRWLAAHRHVVAVGVGWSGGAVDDREFAAEPHDVPLALVVTEDGVVA